MLKNTGGGGCSTISDRTSTATRLFSLVRRIPVFLELIPYHAVHTTPFSARGCRWQLNGYDATTISTSGYIPCVYPSVDFQRQLLLIVIYIATFTARTLRNNAGPRRDCTNHVKMHHCTSYTHMQHDTIPRRDADCLHNSYAEGLPKSHVYHTTTAMDFFHARRYRTHTSLIHQTLNYNDFNINEQHIQKY